MAPNLQNAIVLCGNTGVGKSYFCNRLFELYNVETRFKSSSGVESETSVIQHAQFTRPDGKTFTLLDTPGFFDNHDPTKTAQVDGENMCKFVAALEACSEIYAILFIFTDRFSTPHKLWFDRIRTILTPGRAGHILLLHNKVTLTLREQTVNEVKINEMLGGQGSVEYHWLSHGADDAEVQNLMESIVKLVPFKLNNLVVPEMCYEREEIGPEYTEVIAGPTTTDEGHMEVQTKDTSHYETEVRRGERRYAGIAGPKKKVYVQVWVPSSVQENVWVPKNVTRRTVGTYQNIFKVRFDGTRDLSEKKLIKTIEEVY